AAAFPELPALPGAHFGQGLKVSASEATHFEKEVDLAFPVPAGAPANPKDAFYHVYRKLQGPNGAVLFESVDDAFVEGEGASAKIVTASFPMYGYRHGFNAFDAQHRLQVSAFDAGVPGTMMTAHMVVLWTHNALLPGAPVPGKITGRVIRPKFEPGSPTPVFEGVAGLIVQRDDVNDPHATVAVTQADGRFTFDDPHFTTGASTIRTTYNGQTYTATTFAVARTDSKVATDPALGALVAQGHFTNLATANITLPAAEAPPPAPQVTIRVMRLEDGVRKESNGIVLAGTPLVIGFATEGTINSATIQGEAHAVQRDPLQGQKSALGMDAMVEYTASTPGSYTISVTALPPFGPPVTATGSFRVIAAGSSQLTSVPGRPGVILARTVPKANATGVPVTIFPQVTFTEPVTQISSASVQLIGPDGIVPVKLLAVAVDGAGNPYPIDDLQDPNAVVSSLTLQPTIGLRFGASYRLVLTDAILDRDAPTPQALTPFESSFTTFAPEDLGSTEETPRGAGLVVLGDRAYLAETQYPGGIGNPALQTGQLRTYDVSDPVTPAEVPPPVTIGYAPRDLAGEDRGGQRTLAVATGPKAYFFVDGEFIFTNTIRSSPATLFVYDATSDPPRWVGAATLTSSLEDGVPNRVVVKDGLAYVATVGKGVQVVDLAQARVGFAPDGYAPDATAPELFALRSQIFNSGINHTAVVATVPVVGAGAEFSAPLADLKVADLTVEETGRRLVLATGPRPAVGLVVLDPLSGEKLWRSELLKDGQRLDAGSAVAVATLGGRPVALVGGTGVANGASSGVLFIVDLSPLALSPRQLPSVMSVLALPHQVGDILIKDTTAIVSAAGGANAGAATLIDLTELMAPRIVGSLSGIGSRMAMVDEVLLSTERSFLTGSPTALGGVQTTALGRMLLVQPEKITIPFDLNKTLTDVTIDYRVIGGGEPVRTMEVRVLRNAQIAQQLDAPFDGTKGHTVWPYGSPVQATGDYFVEARADVGTPEELLSRKVPLDVTGLDVIFERERAAIAAVLAERAEPVEDTWDESGKGLEPPVNAYDLKNSSRTFAKSIKTRGGMPPTLPGDYMLLKLPAGAGLVWTETNTTTLRKEVDDVTGRVEATLKATSELAALQVKEVVITAEYFTSDRETQPIKLKDARIHVMNTRLNGLLANMVAGVFGRGEGFDARVAELGVGVVPFAGDVAGILGEVFNALDPTTDVSKVNLALSAIGFATEFTMVTGPAGVALDKGIVVVRQGLKQIKDVPGPLRQLPGRIYDLAKARNWDGIAEHAEGGLKFAWAGGGAFAGRIVREEADLATLNTVVKRYSDDVLDVKFVELLKRSDEVFGDPDAVRGAVRALAGLTDAAGNVIRLSDDAVEGAVKFMARAGADLTPVVREQLLRKLVTASPADVERTLAFIKQTDSPAVVEGIAKMARIAPPCAP
ncbi:MAG TPA: Ig-like domain-containing protein, partial [Vicinamibacterales bacterium]|nr:Ig-like domain-containing protein [Vicinamibacterales bacterium]